MTKSLIERLRHGCQVFVSNGETAAYKELNEVVLDIENDLKERIENANDPIEKLAYKRMLSEIVMEVPD